MSLVCMCARTPHLSAKLSRVLHPLSRSSPGLLFSQLKLPKLAISSFFELALGWLFCNNSNDSDKVSL